MGARPKTALKSRDSEPSPSSEDESTTVATSPDIPTKLEKDGTVALKARGEAERLKKGKRQKNPEGLANPSRPSSKNSNSTLTSPSKRPTAKNKDPNATSGDALIGDLINGARKGIRLVQAPHKRSQQLTFESFINGAKLEVCSKDEGGQLPPKAATPANAVAADTVEHMESALKGLGKLEGEVMAALFPTDGSLPQSYELIASRFGMEVAEVKGIADNALRGLRGVGGTKGRVSTVWN